MKLTVKDEIFNRFPHLRIGMVVGRGLNIRKKSTALRTIIEQNTTKLFKRVGDKKLTDFQNITAWREVYRELGVSPKKYKPTAEAFLKRILKGNPFPCINTAVDAYLAIELLYMLPIGGYDLAKVRGDITLRFSKGDETFLPIGGKNREATRPGEIVYSDDKIVLTRNWNFRDSDHTKITEYSKNIILISEAALSNISSEDLTHTIEGLVEYESRFCRGEYDTYFLDRGNPCVNLSYGDRT
ncbi:MAG: phenylalanine--tRNA ligase beta subunit-related protein [Candidatus Aminicenantes bacterium]|jgi:lysyl-tRNA synthetase class 2